MALIKVAEYRHSRHHRTGTPAIVGPRTFTNAKRAWQGILRAFLPIDPAQPDVVPVEMVTVNMPFGRYSDVCGAVVEQLEALLRDHPTYTDFSWEMWAEGPGSKKRARR